jgi:hypothetical protein
MVDATDGENGSPKSKAQARKVMVKSRTFTNTSEVNLEDGLTRRRLLG